jgi:membrane fusion protein, multidrug efflux system
VSSAPATAVHSLTGSVRARHETELSFRVGGKIQQRLIDVGANVAAGEPLFRLDPEDHQLEVKAAEADLAVAIAAYKQADADELRMRALKSSRTVSDAEYDNSLAQRDIASGRRTAAERSLELARNRLNYTELVSPAAGTITDILAESGQVVPAGKGVARLAHGGELEVAVAVPERWVERIKEFSVNVTYWSLPNLTSVAQLRELSPTADPTTRTYEARYTIADPQPQVKLGMTATLHLRDAAEGDGISLPAGALAGGKDSPHVWKVIDDEGHVAPVLIRVLKYGTDQIVVSGDIERGDRIVSAGVQKIDVGVRVRKWEELR